MILFLSAAFCGKTLQMLSAFKSASSAKIQNNAGSFDPEMLLNQQTDLLQCYMEVIPSVQSHLCEVQQTGGVPAFLRYKIHLEGIANRMKLFTPPVFQVCSCEKVLHTCRSNKKIKSELR